MKTLCYEIIFIEHIDEEYVSISSDWQMDPSWHVRGTDWCAPCSTGKVYEVTSSLRGTKFSDHWGGRPWAWIASDSTLARKVFSTPAPRYWNIDLRTKLNLQRLAHLCAILLAPWVYWVPLGNMPVTCIGRQLFRIRFYIYCRNAAVDILYILYV